MKQPSPTPTKWQKFATGKKPSMKRRCEQNDYQDRCIYMITMATEGRRPLLGRLEGPTEDCAHVVLSPLGREVQACWDSIPQHHPHVETIRLCIMPDHIHGVLFVKERMDYHLGHVINGFKTGTRKAARALGVITSALPKSTGHTPVFPSSASVSSSSAPFPPSSAPVSSFSSAPVSASSSAASSSPSAASAPSSVSSSPSSAPVSASVQYTAAMPQSPSSASRAHGTLWEPNYNDRILLGKGQLARMLAYLDDNPRRLFLKRLHPEFFTRLGTLTVAGRPMQAMGNRFLLDNPVKLQIQCSRRMTADEIEHHRSALLQRAHAEGAIVVSPCISPGEQLIATAAMDAHLPLIVLLLNGFPPFFKPKPRYLEACAAGRLLILAPFPHQNEKLDNMREKCLLLNRMAAELCQNH